MDAAPSSFLLTWGVLTVLGALSIGALSGTIFLKYYVNPTYETWRYKINPKYPPPDKVRLEVIQTWKGLAAATFNPALALYLKQAGYGKAYCGIGDYGWSQLLVSFVVTWVLTDLWNWSYHYLGHRYSFMWEVHKHHHVFFNPSPFAVIADEPPDQLVRSAVMGFLPLLMPINMDLLFLQYAVFFYAYGVYLHWGFEREWPDAHHPWLNTSYHHFCHHAISIKNKPYHCAFYLQIWDQLMGSVYPKDKCFCSKCARKKGEREYSQWQKVEKVDYSQLLSLTYWFRGGNATAKND